MQLAALGVSASMFALFLYITFYLQNHLGHSPLEAGLIYLPFTVINFVVAAAGGALLARLPARVMMSAGLALTGVGLLMMGGLDPADEWTALLGGFLVAGAGIGLLNPVIADVALSVVPKEQSGMAAGINDTFRQVGHRGRDRGLGGDLPGPRRSRGRGAGGRHVRRRRRAAARADRGRVVGQPRQVRWPPCRRVRAETVSDAAGEGFISGLNEIFMLGGILRSPAALVALWLVRERDIEREAPIELPEARRSLERTGTGAGRGVTEAGAPLRLAWRAGRLTRQSIG